jgi:hypothetical protein
MAHAAIGQVFDLPVILSTSADTGPNGVCDTSTIPSRKRYLTRPASSQRVHRNVPQRPLHSPPRWSQVFNPKAPLSKDANHLSSAWDNPEFRAAIEATGKKQVILAGITTDVCTAFLSLSLRAAGYSVFANVEASGTTTELVRDTANDQMARAGVQMYSLFAIVCDLMRDWRNTPGAKEVLPYLDRFMPVYGQLARHHAAAVEAGTIIPGEIGLITGKNGSIVI